MHVSTGRMDMGKFAVSFEVDFYSLFLPSSSFQGFVSSNIFKFSPMEIRIIAFNGNEGQVNSPL